MPSCHVGMSIAGLDAASRSRARNTNGRAAPHFRVCQTHLLEPRLESGLTCQLLSKRKPRRRSGVDAVIQANRRRRLDQPARGQSRVKNESLATASGPRTPSRYHRSSACEGSRRCSPSPVPHQARGRTGFRPAGRTREERPPQTTHRAAWTSHTCCAEPADRLRCTARWRSRRTRSRCYVDERRVMSSRCGGQGSDREGVDIQRVDGSILRGIDVGERGAIDDHVRLRAFHRV